MSYVRNDDDPRKRMTEIDLRMSLALQENWRDQELALERLAIPSNAKAHHYANAERCAHMVSWYRAELKRRGLK